MIRAGRAHNPTPVALAARIGALHMAKSKRGFASSKQRSKASERGRKGGKAVHKKGTAHEFTSDEARKAGSAGGRASADARRKAKLQGQQDRLTDRVDPPSDNDPGDLLDE